MRCKHCSKTFRAPPIEMRSTQVCKACRAVTQNNVDAKDIDISKGQAKILKNIARSISDKDLSEFSLRKALRNKPDTLYFINENWGDEKHFIKLALSYNEKLNPISLILYFLNLRWKIVEIPTKEKMVEISKFDLNEYERRFGTWEKFLDLLGYDPWYRKETIKKETRKPLKTSKKQFLQYETNYFNDNDSFEETIEKINNLRNQIEEDFRQRDSEENYSDYSYVEMFQLLEKYLKILPNKPKYGNIKNLI